MRDLVLIAHILLGAALIALPALILYQLKNKPDWLKPVSAFTAAISWALLLPAGKLYITFYPATKTLIKAGPNPWLHSILMETKEHWGILLPIIATVAAGLVITGKEGESRKWWILVLALSLLLGIMGKAIKMGAV